MNKKIIVKNFLIMNHALEKLQKKFKIINKLINKQHHF